MIKLSKEKPYEDACKILGLRPVANYKSYKLTDETMYGVGTIQIIENLLARSMFILTLGPAVLLLMSVLPWNSKTGIQQKNLQECVNL